jgi:hypothetical protein
LPSGGAFNLAGLINPFSIWFTAMLVYGVMSLGRIGYKAAVISLLPYVVGVALLTVANGNAVKSLGMH